MNEGGALPQSLEAERAVLGGLMLAPKECLVVAETLKPDDFYRESHAKLFALMVGMAEANQPVELLSVIERVASSGMAEDVGGLGYVQTLPNNIPSTQNLEYYATVVSKHAIARRLIEGVQEIEGQARGGQSELDELVVGLRGGTASPFYPWDRFTVYRLGGKTKPLRWPARPPMRWACMC